MRKVIVATLALSPFMLHAQANSPAQPQSTSSSPTLSSQLTQSSDLGYAAGPDHTSGATLTDTRVSTGVVRPKLIHSIDVSTERDITSSLMNFERVSVVDMVVDETGKPSDLKIVKSLGTTMDKNVLSAVSQYRFTPGMLDHQPTAVPVELQVIMRNTPQ
jgi:hypothetical protein